MKKIFRRMMLTPEIQTRVLRILSRKDETINKTEALLDSRTKDKMKPVNNQECNVLMQSLDLWIAELSFVIDAVGLFLYKNKLRQMCEQSDQKIGGFKPIMNLLKESIENSLTKMPPPSNTELDNQRYHINKYIGEFIQLTDSVAEVLIGEIDDLQLDKLMYEPLPDSDLVFVIMSIKDELDAMYEMAFEGAINKCGFRSYRVDREEPIGLITQDILEKIRKAKLIIGDLTYERPNCYFELGYAIGLKKRIILTCRKDHDPRKPNRKEMDPKVHFDLDSQKITFWDPNSLVQLRRELIIRIQNLLINL